MKVIRLYRPVSGALFKTIETGNSDTVLKSMIFLDLVSIVDYRSYIFVLGLGLMFVFRLASGSRFDLIDMIHVVLFTVHTHTHTCAHTHTHRPSANEEQSKTQTGTKIRDCPFVLVQ